MVSRDDDSVRGDDCVFVDFDGMDVVDSINAQYREQPDQGLVQESGNKYLDKNFPKLDFIKKATVVKDKAAADAKAKTEKADAK